MNSMSPPTSPQSRETRPRTTQRTSTMASITSNKSKRSSTSNKLELVETSKDKRRLHTKADPTTALSEAQPAAIALEQSNLEDIRAIQHRDLDGNLITDPDRSNPTRHRLERPLDTIRSFNAAAEGTAHRRSSHHQGNRPSPGNQDYSRRSSYYGNGYSQPPRQRPPPGGYNRHSSYGFRPEHSFPDDVPHPPYGRPPRRQQPQPYYENGDSSGPGNSYGHSYDTMTSGSDEYGKSTNPSSQNSSFDQLHQMQSQRKNEEQQQHQHQHQQQYHHQQQQQQQQQRLSEYENDIQFGNPGVNGYPVQEYSQPQPPPHSYQNDRPVQPQMRQPIAQNRSNGAPSAYNNRAQQQARYNTNGAPVANGIATDKPLPPPKRQSWIRRTFSRHDS